MVREMIGQRGGRGQRERRSQPEGQHNRGGRSFERHPGNWMGGGATSREDMAVVRGADDLQM